MRAAFADKAAEPAFFLALLEATVYAHTPKTDRQGRLRFMQFPLPDSGHMVLPFFSDETQARAAAGTTAKVVVLTGRQLFELTRGATLMLNPNSTNCTLYPEEIAALLDSGEVAIVDKFTVSEPKLMDFREPEPSPTWLIDPLIALYAQLSCVESAYLVEMKAHDDPDPDHAGWLIALAVASANSERAVRATITTIQSLCREHTMTVDLMTFVPDVPPGWVHEVDIGPFYTRTLGQRMITGTISVQ